jgi:hypothetical protein
MMWYASWNGATEVRKWRFYGSGSKAGPWETVATVEKNGFETIYSHEDTFVWTYAEAMDKNDVILGKSDVQKTFTPNENLKEYCDDLACRFMPTDDERKKEKEDRQKEQDEKEALLHQTKKKVIVYGGSFGGLAVLLLILVILSTRNVVRKPAMAVAANVVRVFHKTKKDDGVSAYKALSLEDQDSDRAPMIGHGS